MFTQVDRQHKILNLGFIGFTDQGFGGLGFRDLGVWGLGFRDLGV